MKLKETIIDIFREIYSISMLVILSPLLIIVGLCFSKDEMVRGRGE